MTDHTALTVATERQYQAIDVTDRVIAAVSVSNAAIAVSVPHTTCALFLSEVDDELLSDLEQLGATMLAKHEPFTHARNGVANAAAHIVSSMFGTSILMTMSGGIMQLGRYQRIVLLELDGGKDRQLDIRVIAKE